jgi:hypothetical protein
MLLKYKLYTLTLKTIKVIKLILICVISKITVLNNKLNRIILLFKRIYLISYYM